MALCDELEAKLRQAEGHSEKLMNAAVQHVLQTVASADQVDLLKCKSQSTHLVKVTRWT